MVRVVRVGLVGRAAAAPTAVAKAAMAMAAVAREPVAMARVEVVLVEVAWAVPGAGADLATLAHQG